MVLKGLSVAQEGVGRRRARRRGASGTPVRKKYAAALRKGEHLLKALDIEDELPAIVTATSRDLIQSGVLNELWLEWPIKPHKDNRLVFEAVNNLGYLLMVMKSAVKTQKPPKSKEKRRAANRVGGGGRGFHTWRGVFSTYHLSELEKAAERPIAADVDRIKVCQLLDQVFAQAAYRYLDIGGAPTPAEVREAYDRALARGAAFLKAMEINVADPATLITISPEQIQSEVFNELLLERPVEPYEHEHSHLVFEAIKNLGYLLALMRLARKTQGLRQYGRPSLVGPLPRGRRRLMETILPPLMRGLVECYTLMFQQKPSIHPIPDLDRWETAGYAYTFPGEDAADPDVRWALAVFRIASGNTGGSVPDLDMTAHSGSAPDLGMKAHRRPDFQNRLRVDRSAACKDGAKTFTAAINAVYDEYGAKTLGEYFYKATLDWSRDPTERARYSRKPSKNG